MNSSNLLPKKVSSIALGLGGIGLVASAIGAIVDLPHMLQSYLLAYAYWTGLSLGALGLLLLQYVASGEWGRVIRRVLEAASLNLPVMALFFIPIVAGMTRLYVWSVHPGAHVNTDYLNVPFVIGRSVFYFAIWSALALQLRRWSLKRDDGSYTGSGPETLGGIGLLIYVLAVTFSSIDWIMSIDPEWSSTIFGVLIMVGDGLAAMSVCIIVLDAATVEKEVSVEILHDLGNLTFMFILLWGYMSLSQFLVIWSGNLPEEIPWYLRRREGGWASIATVLILFHFALPFFLLLIRSIKRDKKKLRLVALFILAIHFVDCYWLIMPTFRPESPMPAWQDVAAMLGIGGIWVALLTHWLNSAPLFAKQVLAVEPNTAAHAGGTK